MEIRLVIKSLGIAAALIAVVYMLRPDMVKRFVGFLEKGSRIYFDAVINCALAAVLLIGARHCKYSWIIFGCGFVFLAEGLLIIGLGPEKTRPLLDWSREQPDELFQFLGLLVGVLGIAMTFSA